MQLFLSKRERWAEMGEASLAKSRPHHLSNTVQRYIEWYESVIGRPVYAQMRQPDQQMSVTTQG